MGKGKKKKARTHPSAKDGDSQFKESTSGQQHQPQTKTGCEENKQSAEGVAEDNSQDVIEIQKDEINRGNVQQKMGAEKQGDHKGGQKQQQEIGAETHGDHKGGQKQHQESGAGKQGDKKGARKQQQESGAGKQDGSSVGQKQQQEIGAWKQSGQNNGKQQFGAASRSSSRLSSSQVTKLTSTSDTDIAASAEGSAGELFPIEVNYVELILKNIIPTAYRYDIKFTPNTPKRILRLAFNKYRESVNHKCLVFDGKSIVYSPMRLQHDFLKSTVEVDVVDPNELGDRRLKRFQITLTENKNLEIDLTILADYKNYRIFDMPKEACQCLDVVLQDVCFAKGKKAGRSFYRPHTEQMLGEGFALWLGLFQSVVFGERPLFNIDVSHKAFSTEISLIELLKMNSKIDVEKVLPLWSVKNLENILKGFNIIYNDPAGTKRFSKFNGLVKNPELEMLSDRNISVAEYFANDKKYNLKYPKLPCIHIGNPDKKNYIPLELSYLPAGQTRKDATVNQVRALIKAAATTTDIRKKKIMELFKYFDQNQNPIIERFGISLGRNFIEVHARMIKSPNLLYQNKEVLHPYNSKWKLRNVKFLKPAELSQTTIWVMDKQSEHLAHSFKKLLLMHAPAVGIIIDKVNIDSTGYNYKNPKFSIDTKMEQFSKQKVKLVFVVLSGYNYAKIKQSAELNKGVLTQCIKAETLEKRLDPNTVINILLKVNAKLNGINQTIVSSDRTNVLGSNVMLIGADVTHPGPNSNVPSVVGVTASHDSNFFQFNMAYDIQDSKKEMIMNMENICRQHLEFYKSKLGQYPDKIIYYRDGVSDTQYKELKDIELAAMERAFKVTGKKPSLTCIVVQKRHHTRFFPGANVSKEDKYHNCPPGTIVDNGIRHPKECQFFLQSHEPVQGVARPTKYWIVRNDANFKIDDLQAATYNLCYMFARCNRAVSYPAPTYYAHLIAARGKAYIEGERLNLKNLGDETKKRTIKREIQQGNPMFFV